MKTAGLGLALAAGFGLAIAVQAADRLEPLVVRVFDDFRTASEIGFPPGAYDCPALTPLVRAVVEPVLEDFARRERLAVGEEDLKDYCRRQLPAGATFREAWAEWKPGGSQWRTRQRAAGELEPWKLHRALFAKSGGRVMPVPGGQPQAVEAIVALVAEREQTGDVAFYDERLKRRFWECLRYGWGRLVSAEEGWGLIEQHPAERGNPAPSRAP